jgi:DNA-binding MarR family transcriptional regulator
MSAAYARTARLVTLPLNLKRVLIALCNACNDAGECDVPQSALACTCALHQGTVSGAVIALEKRGYLRIEPHPHRYGNRYRITAPGYWPSRPSFSAALFRAFPTCSLLKPNAASFHERA